MQRWVPDSQHFTDSPKKIEPALTALSRVKVSSLCSRLQREGLYGPQLPDSGGHNCLRCGIQDSLIKLWAGGRALHIHVTSKQLLKYCVKSQKPCYKVWNMHLASDVYNSSSTKDIECKLKCKWVPPPLVQLLYCPKHAPMGARSSSTKKWGWAVTRGRCLKSSTISVQKPTRMRT